MAKEPGEMASAHTVRPQSPARETHGELRFMTRTTKFSFDVFLSHNSQDKERVRRLAERLRDRGRAGLVRRMGDQAGR
jgi:hypothetical protein